MENAIIQKVLLSVFNKLTSNSAGFFDVFGYKTAEVITENLPTFGLGIYEENPSIKVFVLDDRYRSSDARRYKSVITIRRRVVDMEKREVWDVEFTDEATLIEEIGKFQEFVKSIHVIQYVMGAIELEEKIFLAAV